MYNRRNRWISTITLLFMLFSLINPAIIQAAEEPLADGEYTIDFTVLKNGTEETSMMDDYTEKPAKVTVTEATYTIDVTLKNSEWIPAFQVQQEDGSYADAEVVSEDTEANTRVVRLYSTDLSEKIYVYTHVVVPDIGYDHWYYVQFQFDADSLSPIEDEPAGDDEGDDVDDSGDLTDEDETAQTYDLSFTVLKDGTDTVSSMQKYVVNPANVTFEDGKALVSFTLKNSSMVTVLQYEQNGEYVDATVLSTDEENDTRVVQFEVDYLFKKLNVSLEVDTGTSFGVMQHTVQFLFDTTDLPVPLNYTIYKDGTEETSEMENYTLKPAWLTIRDGVYYVSLTLMNSSMITLFQTEKDGEFVDANVIDTNEEEDTRTVEFEVANLDELLDVRLEVDAGSYGMMQHTVQFAFDTGETEEELSEDPEEEAGEASDSGTGEEEGDTENTIQFTVLKDGTEETSMMDEYTEKPAHVTLTDSLYAIDVTLKNSDWIPVFQVQQEDGTYADAEVVSEDTEANTRVVRLYSTDLSEKIYVYTHVVVPDLNYDNWYYVQFQFDADSLTLTEDESTEDAEGDDDTTDSSTGSGGSSGSATSSENVHGLDDGYYTIDYTFLKYGTDQTSVMQDYVITPALLKVSGSKMYIYMTFTQAEEITGFKVEGKSASTADTNEEDNTKVMKFKVDDLTETIDTWVKIDWAEYDYFHEYDVQLEFDLDSIEETDDDEVPGFEESDSTSSTSSGTTTSTEEETDETVDTEESEDAEDTEDSASNENEEGSEEASEGTKFPADIQGHWSLASIQRAMNLGIVSGYEDGTFRPNGSVNRAEFIVMLGRALQLETSEQTLSFADGEDIPSWATPYISTAVDKGLISGYSDQTFRPTQSVSRAEIAVMVVKALELPLDDPAELPFSDSDQIPEWAKPYVSTVFNHGLMSGRENQRFDANKGATRAESVVLILRMLDYFYALEEMQEAS